jgi:transposase-like protein
MYRLTDKERYVQIKEDLINIQRIGVEIKSITCDGHPAILKAIKIACEGVVVQRCLVHIHRESNIWLRKRPVNQRSVALKQIVNLIFKIESNNDKQAWILQFEQWYKTNKNYINEKKVNEVTGRWWYRHKNLRRTAVMIKKALPNMFQFLDNPDIPKSTNCVESFFGHLKNNLSIHRGMSYSHRKAFVQWYLNFKNQDRK